MNSKNTQHNRQKGFTIIELMIATTIFSLVLMICLAAIMTITRMYYQGTLQARTQNKVREIVDQIADDIRFRPGEVVLSSGVKTLSTEPELADGSVGSIDPRDPQNYYGQYCIGDTRYRYLIGFKTDGSASGTDSTEGDRVAARPLMKESINNGCSASNALGTGRDDILSELVESTQESSVLDENMRLLEFDISEVYDDTYRLAVTIAYGDDDMIGLENGNFICRPDNVARAYCATSRIEVYVTRRMNTN